MKIKWWSFSRQRMKKKTCLADVIFPPVGFHCLGRKTNIPEYILLFLCKNLTFEQKTCWRSRIHCRIPGWRFSGGKKDVIWFLLHLVDLTGGLYDAVCFRFVFNTFFRFSLGPARASHRIIAVLSVPLGIPQYCSIDASSSNTRQCVQLRLLPLTEWWSFFRCFSCRITSFL